MGELCKASVGLGILEMIDVCTSLVGYPYVVTWLFLYSISVFCEQDCMKPSKKQSLWLDGWKRRLCFWGFFIEDCQDGKDNVVQ